VRAGAGRGERIRTSDILLPKQALYQAEPRPAADDGAVVEGSPHLRNPPIARATDAASATAGATSDFTAEARFGLDWLQRMWDQSSRTLAYQVGIGTDFATFNFLSDHNIWRLPQDDDTYGGTDPICAYIRRQPLFRAGTRDARLSHNPAGRLAADFALSFGILRATYRSHAERCLAAAATLFDLPSWPRSGSSPINGYGPRVGQSGFGPISGFAYTGPFEDITIKS
jgi:hypothetical protein